MSLFQIVNYSLILLALVLFVRYIWDVIVNPGYEPAAWKRAKQEKKVPSILLKIGRSYPDKMRFFSWWLQVGRLKKEQVPGAFAELGVYKGASARVLHHMDPLRKFHLLDTFGGFTEQDLSVERGEAATYTIVNFADTDMNKVIDTIEGNSNVIIHPGYFPVSASKLILEKFALVNIDADLYNPTRAGLEFFYPRLSPGGVIFVHDYNYKWEGVIRAVDEFCKTIPETRMILPDKEGTVMIIRNKY